MPDSNANTKEAHPEQEWFAAPRTGDSLVRRGRGGGGGGEGKEEAAYIPNHIVHL